MYQLDILGVQNDTSWTFDEEPDLEFFCPEAPIQKEPYSSAMLLMFRGEFTARYPNGGKVKNAVPQRYRARWS